SLGEHALELLRGRAVAFVDDVLDALAEAVPGLEGRGDGDQEVGEGVLDRPQAPARLEPDEAERKRRTEDERQEDDERRGGGEGGDEADQETTADGDVEELDRPQRQVGALEQP